MKFGEVGRVYGVRTVNNTNVLRLKKVRMGYTRHSVLKLVLRIDADLMLFELLKFIGPERS